MSRKITIVGAGLVGSLWATLAAKRGHSVEVFEKRLDPRKSALAAGRSINLVITSRGLHGLERAGLLQDALALCVPVYGRYIHTLDSQTRFQPYGREGDCNYSVSRTGLNRFLIDAAERAGAVFHFAQGLSEVDFDKRILRFSTAQGKVDHGFELLFGADGAASVVRKELVRDSSGSIQESTDWLDVDYKELLIPPGPNGSFPVEKNALHIWPRGSHMMMALANLDGSFTVTLYLPKSGSEVAFDRLKSPGSVQALFESQFPDAIRLMPGYEQQFVENPQGVLGNVHCSRWTRGDRAALLGDAAHAIVPFFGQGMNSGFEDCTVLLDCLHRHGDDWGSVLATYESIQRENAQAIATMAVENWVEMRDRVADPQFQLRKQVEAFLEREHPTRYRSRYGMIAYTLIPYRLAQLAGHVQEKMLAELCAGLESAEKLDPAKALASLEKYFEPFVQKHALSLKAYRPG